MLAAASTDAGTLCRRSSFARHKGLAWMRAASSFVASSSCRSSQRMWAWIPRGIERLRVVVLAGVERHERRRRCVERAADSKSTALCQAVDACGFSSCYARVFAERGRSLQGAQEEYSLPCGALLPRPGVGSKDQVREARWTSLRAGRQSADPTCVGWGDAHSVSALHIRGGTESEANVARARWFSMFCVVAVGCRVAPPPPPTVAPLGEPGLQVLRSPRDDYAPGTVFRIGFDGVSHLVVDLSRMLKPTVAMEVFPTIAVRGSLEEGISLRLLGTDSLAARDTTEDSIFVSASGTRRETAYEADLKPVVDSAIKLITWEPRSTYYLITEAVVADSLAYRLSVHALASFGGAAKVASLVTTSGRRTWSWDGRSELATRFPKPLRVFFKAERLTPLGAAFGGGVFKVERKPVLSAITWLTESSEP